MKNEKLSVQSTNRKYKRQVIKCTDKDGNEYTRLSSPKQSDSWKVRLTVNGFRRRHDGKLIVLISNRETKKACGCFWTGKTLSRHNGSLELSHENMVHVEQSILRNGLVFV